MVPLGPRSSLRARSTIPCGRRSAGACFRSGRPAIAGRYLQSARLVFDLPSALRIRGRKPAGWAPAAAAVRHTEQVPGRGGNQGRAAEGPSWLHGDHREDHGFTPFPTQDWGQFGDSESLAERAFDLRRQPPTSRKRFWRQEPADPRQLRRGEIRPGGQEPSCPRPVTQIPRAWGFLKGSSFLPPETQNASNCRSF